MAHEKKKQVRGDDARGKEITEGSGQEQRKGDHKEIRLTQDRKKEEKRHMAANKKGAQRALGQGR